MTLPTLWSALCLLWLAAEIAIALGMRARTSSGSVRDRGSLITLWFAIGAGLAGSAWALRFQSAHIAGYAREFQSASLVLLIFGLLIRGAAIVTLGRHFTANVAIQNQHSLVRIGLYRYLRHPSYSGMLLAFVAVGVRHRDWLSFVILIVPITVAVLYRISVEERALRDAFGTEYTDYASVTKRLLPGVF